MNLSELHKTVFQQDSVSTKIPELENARLQEPAPIPFTFETIGWKILGIVILVSILIILLLWIRNYIKNRYRREALQELNIINTNEINETFRILKNTAIKAYGREKVGNLYGNKWLSFLEETGKEVKMLEFENAIFNSIYRDKKIDQNIYSRITENSKKWIRTHA
ncbi:DUF4381 domain-containing protein [Gramella lutea]|uniref:DUF4381 domain-containing protein n=1 Tax=Christiangramia lutea TaxID=1607951 RepID=A0A9X1V152_9FLAO|nr:DUF4381 domain-containing protein [Christiangramia lutea]MCH4821751.1 DUF4381 domain-containing protein [Christiangramia lutea]